MVYFHLACSLFPQRPSTDFRYLESTRNCILLSSLLRLPEYAKRSGSSFIQPRGLLHIIRSRKARTNERSHKDQNLRILPWFVIDLGDCLLTSVSTNHAAELRGIGNCKRNKCQKFLAQTGC